MVKAKVTDNTASGLRGRRAVQAEQTRLEILGAARRQFAASGYAGTSIREIAADAGVSVQTVYDSVGSKADLVRGLNDLIDGETGVREIAMTVPALTDPIEVARVPARITRRLVERCGDILRAIVDGARAEPDLAEVAEEGGRRHRVGSRAVTDRLAELGALDPHLTPEAAATTVAVLADARLALVLMDDHGLDPEAVEDWIADTTAGAVLNPGRARPAPGSG